MDTTTAPTHESRMVVLLASALADQIQLDYRAKYIEINLCDDTVASRDREDLLLLANAYVDQRMAEPDMFLVFCITSQNADGSIEFAIYTMPMPQPS